MATLVRCALDRLVYRAHEREWAASSVLSKGSDLSVHSAADLDWVAQELTDRPRKRLAFKKPIEQIGELLLR